MAGWRCDRLSGGRRARGRYAAYLEVGNAHDFDRLGEFVAADVPLISEIGSVSDRLAVQEQLRNGANG